MTREQATKLFNDKMTEKGHWAVRRDAYEIAVAALMECEYPAPQSESRPLHMYLGAEAKEEAEHA